MLPSDFPELAELERIIEEGASHLDARTACEVAAGERRFPVHVVTLGNPDPAVPAVGYFGGFHGLERIGTEVVLAYLRSLVMRLRWDETLHRQLEAMCLVFVPLLNPGGLWRGTRANPNGVDLMRNAPQDAEEPVPWLVGGQRLSAALPWYRGARGAAMERESSALCDLIRTELLGRPFSLALDCHSGFGMNDRLWFPCACSAQPIEHLPELQSLSEMLDQALLHHRYIMEPQSRQYLAHGDLWDHLYLGARSASPSQVFLPLTLEMGSWLWIKKNPRQMFSRHGIFNPLIQHRQQRVLRRHLSLLDFVGRAAGSHARWLPQGDERDQHRRRALARWYGGRST